MNQPQQQYGPPPGPGTWQGPPPQQQWQGPPQNQQWQGPPQQQWHGNGQQQWTAHQPSGNPSLGTHLKRAIDWNVATVVVSPRERQALEAAGVTERLQGLFAWRRSSLLVALPFLVLGTILSFYNVLKDDGLNGLSGLGAMAALAPPIALGLVPLGCLAAIGKWTHLRDGSRFLVVCWLLSIVLPLLAALIPLDYLVDGDLSTVDDSTVLGIRIVLAVNYALMLLPVVLSVPGGVLKGAARVKSLFPSSVLPGWFLVSVAPFYSMFTVVVFVLIDQIVGNGLLMLGVGMLAFGPWLFVIYRKVYARPLSIAESQNELSRASRLGGIFLWGGVVCIVIFALTAKVGHRDVLGASSGSGHAYFSYLDVTNTLVQTLARGIVTAVVFSVFFMQMIHSEWRAMRGIREDIRAEHDREMRALERYVSRTDTIETAQTTVHEAYRPGRNP